VLRHRTAAAACAFLTVIRLEGAAQIRPADGFLHNHCPHFKGFYKRFFSDMVFYNCQLRFSHRKYFLTMCTTIRSYNVGVWRRLRLEIRKERIFKVPQSKFACPGCAPAAQKFLCQHCKAVEVVKNATGYKCEISPATNDLNVVQIAKIYIAVQCIFNICICIDANYEPAD